MLRRIAYEYNELIRGRGVYLKPVHLVYKEEKVYIYMGRYWYRLERKQGKLKWRYLGKTKPYDDLPDPPVIPQGVIIKVNGRYLLEDRLFNELEKIMEEIERELDESF